MKPFKTNPVFTAVFSFHHEFSNFQIGEIGESSESVKWNEWNQWNEVDKWTDDEAGDLMIPKHVAHREVGQDLSSPVGPQKLTQLLCQSKEGQKVPKGLSNNAMIHPSGHRTEDTLDSLEMKGNLRF